jgi:hypothetical protein
VIARQGPGQPTLAGALACRSVVHNLPAITMLRGKRRVDAQESAVLTMVNPSTARAAEGEHEY